MPYRLKHIPSQRYLAIVEGPNPAAEDPGHGAEDGTDTVLVVMTTQPLGDSSLFRFQPLDAADASDDSKKCALACMPCGVDIVGGAVMSSH